MHVFYTLHAKRRMIKKKIDEVWVEETIRQPDLARNDSRAFYAQKKLNGKSIEVVYMKEKYIRVITVYWI